VTNAAVFDPWVILGLPRVYELERSWIERHHLRRVANLHPDRIGDPVRREEASRTVAILNEARDLLLDDERRADCLLALLGGPSKESDRSLPEGFLLEIMGLRESLEEAAASGDPQRRAAVEAEASQRRAAHRAAVATLFAEACAGSDPAVLRRIRLELNAWRYIERLREALVA